MRLTMTLILIFGFASTPAATDGKGAKAMFVDSTSGAIIRSENNASSRRTARKGAGRPASSAAAADVSGLMYYLELVLPGGETSRVTSDRVFTSGERIRLHVTSSMDGDIAVLQRTPDGRTAQLFPDQRIRNGDAHIEKGVDTILPSPVSWFRFDQNAGTEELTLVLTPRATVASPQTPPRSIQIVSMQYDEIASSAGSKGLVVETDSAGPAQGTYVVRRPVSGKPPEPVVVTIRLKHR